MNVLRLLKAVGPIYDVFSEWRNSEKMKKHGSMPSDSEVLRAIYTGQGIPELDSVLAQTVDATLLPSTEEGEEEPLTPASVIAKQEEDKPETSFDVRSPEECLDCSFKHLSTARVNLEEATQWLNNKEPKQKVLKKIHTAFDQLAGAEEATRMTNDPGVKEINKMIRDTRKKHWSSGIALDVNNPEEIKEFMGSVNAIYDKTLHVAKGRRDRVIDRIGEMETQLGEAKSELSKRYS